MTLFSLKPCLPDALLATAETFRRDDRKTKLDLSIGVYRDDQGQTPIFRAVRAAEARLCETQTSKAYLGSEGNLAFVSELAHRAVGNDRPLTGLQTVGGTGALCLAAEVLAQDNPGRRVFVGLPSWPNHVPIFKAAGLAVAGFGLTGEDNTICQPEAVLAALRQAERGDVVLLQGGCHNPTGVDPDCDLWDAIARDIAKRELVLLLDVAYQGFGDGWHGDGDIMRRMLKIVPNVLIAYSCSKNFGLYRERVGVLFIAADDRRSADNLLSHLGAAARVSYSMPPDHGAATVHMILADERLREDWQAELDAMRQRVSAVRAKVAGYGMVGAIDLAELGQGKGMFSLLPLDGQQVDLLRQRHGIYIAGSGRINLAGLSIHDVGCFVAAVQDAQTAFH